MGFDAFQDIGPRSKPSGFDENLNYGFGINKNIINILHKEILESIKPNLTFLLKLNVNEAIKRINKRKVINRYDRLTKKFYVKRYIVLDTSRNIKDIEKAIYDNFLRIYKK